MSTHYSSYKAVMTHIDGETVFVCDHLGGIFTMTDLDGWKISAAHQCV